MGLNGVTGMPDDVLEEVLHTDRFKTRRENNPTFVMSIIKGGLIMHSLGPLRHNGLFGQGRRLVVRHAVCCAFPLHRPSVVSPCIFTAAQLWALYWHEKRAGFALVLSTSHRAL